MKKENNILSGLDKNGGFKCPDGYFENFTSRLIEQLPEKEIEEEPSPRQIFWRTARPWMYMAAMFIGIALMIRVFDGFTIEKESGTGETVVGANEVTLDEYVYYTSLNEYDIYETLFTEDE